METTAYLGDGGPVDHSTINSYWVSAAAATRTRTGLPDLTANWVEPAETYDRQAITGSGATTWRYTETDTSYDATTSDADFGLPTRVYTHAVPVNVLYDRCETTSYAAPDTTVNLVGLPAESETDSVACGGFTEGSPASVPAALNTLTAPASVSRPAQVIDETRTFYDDPGFSATFPQSSPPSKGDVTMTEKASGYSGGAFTYQVTGKAAYDSFGRPVAAYDANGNKSTTAYAMNAAGLTTGTTVTNPLNQAVTTTLDPERGLTLTSTDPNGVVTTKQYDALGRDTSVWLDSRPVSSPANYLFAYQVSDSGLTAVTTQELNEENGYQTSVDIYDALLRPRQTQAMTPQGGRLVTDTFYDTRGWTEATFTGWWDSADTPSVTLATKPDLAGEAPVEDYYTYDGLGKAVIDKSENGGAVVSVTTTVYNGDRTTVIPPAGGVTKTTITDPLGRTSELEDYTSAPTLSVPANTFTGTFTVTGGTFTPTGYGYDGHGNQSVISVAGRTFTSTYNLLGQVTAKADPDAGTTTMGYDPNGNLLQATDARGKTISFTYDALNRKTGEYDAPVASQSPADQLASWTYDNSNGAVSAMPHPVGHLTTETAFWNGAAYTTQQKGFNISGEPLGETITIPSAEGALAGSYTFQHAYAALTGLPLKDAYPAAGGLPAETLLYGYSTELDLPTTVDGLVGYSEGVTYDAWGRVNQETIGNSTGLADITSAYDPHTGLLTSQAVTRRTATPAAVDTQAYSYDLSGNITSQTSTRLGVTSSSETQCYAYDQLDRLSAAWTATDNCATAPSPGNSAMVGDNLAGSSAYWTTWGFDALGNRTTQTDHATAPGGTDTTTGYAYNGNGAGQPDSLTSTAASGGATAGTSYGYDADGNMTTRTAGAGSQTLTWDDAGRLTGVAGSTSGDSSFIYDADGNLLLEKDPGATTLYLPGEQLTLNTATQAVSGIRYYPLPGGSTAYRTGAGNAYGYEITDQHGTSLLSLDYTAQQPAWREQTPYGAPRGQAVAWIDNRAFLDKPADPATGLDIIGARNYDPATGRFISVDPLLEATSSQELGGYAYAADNPVTQSDPSGLHACGDTCGGPTVPGQPGWICGCGGGASSGGGGSHSGGGGGDGTGGWYPPPTSARYYTSSYIGCVAFNACQTPSGTPHRTVPAVKPVAHKLVHSPNPGAGPCQRWAPANCSPAPSGNPLPGVGHFLGRNWPAILNVGGLVATYASLYMVFGGWATVGGYASIIMGVATTANAAASGSVLSAAVGSVAATSGVGSYAADALAVAAHDRAGVLNAERLARRHYNPVRLYVHVKEAFYNGVGNFLENRVKPALSTLSTVASTIGAFL
jgi:RHS repeat-associated protein